MHSMPLLTDSPQILQVQLFLQHFHLSFRCLILPLHLRKANNAGVASVFVSLILVLAPSVVFYLI